MRPVDYAAVTNWPKEIDVEEPLQLGSVADYAQRSSRADLRERIAYAITGAGSSEGSWRDALSQADRVIDSLGLYEERRTNVMSSGGMSTDYKTGVTTVHSDMRYDRRWVSAWKEISRG